MIKKYKLNSFATALCAIAFLGLIHAANTEAGKPKSKGSSLFANQLDKDTEEQVLSKAKETLTSDWQEAKTWAKYLNSIWKPQDKFNMEAYTLDQYWQGASIKHCSSENSINYRCEIKVNDVEKYSISTIEKALITVSYELNDGSVERLKIIKSPFDNLEHRVSRL